MSHPSVCPKCKYNRPIFLSYCPHFRDLSPHEKENARKERQDYSKVADFPEKQESPDNIGATA